MDYYYLDIETVPLESCRHIDKASFDANTAKIITIQYQQLDEQTGAPIGELVIFKEWEQYCSEELIVKLFKQKFVDNGIWNFIPVGNNLAFDFKFLKAKFNQYCGEEPRRFGQRPLIDIKSTLVMMNRAQFKGSAELVGKSDEAKNIESWYYSKEYRKIEDYIRREASSFIQTYQILLKELPRIRLG